uniref:Arginine kinase n=1 Tax=Rhabditophanes sp. KR3021 TaxID=114890 RepID=A0AC35TN06_9BILA
MSAFLKPKALVGGLAALAGGASAYFVAYPYTREVYMTNAQINENDAFTVRKIEESYKKLQDAENCNSLLKKHLTKEVVDKLKYRRTKLGASLYDVIRSGVFNLDAGVGVYAPDAESYETFKELFDPIIEEYHGFSAQQSQPEVDLGEGKHTDFPPLDKEGKYIKSTRIRCGRSLAGYPFNPLLSEDDYLIMEQKVKNALTTFKEADLKGKYYALTGMTVADQKDLIASHFLFKNGDRHLQHANSCKYWPKGRGIFHNDQKTFLIWVNEEDHLRIISMQNGSDVGSVLDRLVRGIKTFEKQVQFSRSPRFGWYTHCPTNLGSTVRASVHISLPKLSKRSDFNETCEKLQLQVRGIHGEHSESEGGIYDISNKARLGITEYQAVKQMYDGIKELIRIEQSL